MTQYIQDTKLIVRNALRENWDNSSLPESLTDDDIHTGWYDGDKSYPQISVTRSDEGVVNGGTSGFTGIAGDGSGGTQQRSGVVLVDVWAGSANDYSSRGEEELQAEQMARVVEEALHDYNHTDLTTMTVTTRTNFIDTDDTPASHRVQLEVTYVWQKTPT